MDQRLLHRRKSGSTLSRLLERSLYRRACPTLTLARTISKISSQGHRHPPVVSISILLGRLRTAQLAILSKRIIPATTRSWVGNASAKDSQRADSLPCFKSNNNCTIPIFLTKSRVTIGSGVPHFVTSIGKPHQCFISIRRLQRITTRLRSASFMHWRCYKERLAAFGHRWHKAFKEGLKVSIDVYVCRQAAYWSRSIP